MDRDGRAVLDVTETVIELESIGWLTRTTDPEDHVVFLLTAAGEAALRQALPTGARAAS